MTFEHGKKPKRFKSWLVGWASGKEKESFVQSPEEITGENPGDVPGIVEIDGPDDPKIGPIVTSATGAQKDVALAKMGKKKWVLIVGGAIVLSAVTAYGVTEFVRLLGRPDENIKSDS